MADDHKKRRRQRFFVARELRLSILLIILISFFASILFMYLITAFGGPIYEYSVVSFIIVMLGYALVVAVLTLFFSHRFIGPFERLKLEMAVILAGDYKRRLTIRRHDDIYVRSFIDEVNKLIDCLENNFCISTDVFKEVDDELTAVIEETKDEAVKARLVRLSEKIRNAQIKQID